MKNKANKAHVLTSVQLVDISNQAARVEDGASDGYFHQLGPLGRVGLVVAMCVFVMSPFHVLHFETYFFPTSRSWISKNFRDSEYLGKSAEKKWSQN